MPKVVAEAKARTSPVAVREELVSCVKAVTVMTLEVLL